MFQPSVISHGGKGVNLEYGVIVSKGMANVGVTELA